MARPRKQQERGHGYGLKMKENKEKEDRCGKMLSNDPLANIEENFLDLTLASSVPSGPAIVFIFIFKRQTKGTDLRRAC